MCELQILDNSAEKYAQLDPSQYHGSAYGMVPAKRGHLKPVGEWNRQTVTVIGSTIHVVLNDECILDADLSEVSTFMGGQKNMPVVIESLATLESQDTRAAPSSSAI